MRVSIIGTDHDLQKVDSPDNGLKEKIEAIVSRGDVVLIAEEVDANKDVETFGRELSRKLIGENRWLSVDMTDAQRKDAGIYDDLICRNVPDFSQGLPPRSVCRYFRRADGIREDFWLDRIAERCKELTITEGTVVITCGSMHKHNLCEKAGRRGHIVTLDEYLSRDSRDLNRMLLVCD